jgi:uncharacterized oligopeptide transporter (OPT) family protein
MDSSRPDGGYKPFVDANRELPEFTLQAVLLGIVFGILFGAVSTYLGLCAGLTVSASIPISVLAISVFKRLGRSSILENNIVQTTGSAGESLAAGVIFNLPGLSAGVLAHLFPRHDRRLARHPVHDSAASLPDCAGARRAALS